MVTMKRIFILVACTLIILFTGSAQNRIIKMPELPGKSFNIAEMEKGYWCSIEINSGATLMEGHKNLAFVNVEYTNGYRFSQWLKVGAGLGVTYYVGNNDIRNTDKNLSMPLFVNARGNLLTESIRYAVPFWAVNIGTSLPDGFFFAPTIGLRFGEPRSAFLLGLSYSLRHLKTDPCCIDYYSGAMIKLGYEF